MRKPGWSAGDPNAQWAHFQEQKSAHINLRLRLSTGSMTDFQEPGTNTGSVFEAKFPKLGPSKIVKNARIGKASDFWNLYEKDIQLAADIGTKMTGSSLSEESLMPYARACVTLQEADTEASSSAISCKAH